MLRFGLMQMVCRLFVHRTLGALAQTCTAIELLPGGFVHPPGLTSVCAGARLIQQKLKLLKHARVLKTD
jgi:hypothetical protein